MIGVRINSLSEVEAEIKRRINSVPETAARVAKKIVIDNSAQGNDIKERKMKEYSPAYGKWRSRHGLTSAPSDLRVKGRLLDNQNVKVQGMKSSVEPSPDRKIIAEGNLRYRKFYPETDSDIIPSFEKRIIEGCEKVMGDRK